MFIEDRLQRQHTVRRNFPLLGPLSLWHRKPWAFSAPVFVRYRSRPVAIQSRRAQLGVSRGEKSRQHRGLRLDAESERAGHGDFRQQRLPRAGAARRTAEAVADWPVLCQSVYAAIAVQYFRHEFRRVVEAGGAGAVARRGEGGLLDGYRRRRAWRRIIWRAAATSSCRSARRNTACAISTAN